MADRIAERVVDAHSADGARFQFHFAIEAPKPIDEESWGCVLLMQGFDGRPDHRVVGQDAWQAITLAFCLVEQLLGYFLADGGSLFWEDSDVPMALSDVIPRPFKGGVGS